MGGFFGIPVPEDQPKVLKGYFENIKNVDIIVNSTDRTLQLSAGGGVSQTIGREGGPNIQQELYDKYPKGIQPGEIAVTSGYNLPYKYVYHCSLQHIEGIISHHKIREIVSKCLQKAKNQDQISSIAFPVIGTGSMGFHYRVVRAMYRAILEFLLQNPLFKVYIIIHPSKTDLIDYVKKINRSEELKRLDYPVTLAPWWRFAFSLADNIQRKELTKTDADYHLVYGKFNKTIRRRVEIIKIERIFNKRLFFAYEHYKYTLPNDRRTEKFLWHGTKEDCVNGIIEHGFDMRLTKRAVWGQGCYFAAEASYSDDDRYAAPNNRGEKHMFLANVAIGKCMIGHCGVDDCTIPNGYQSTVNNGKTIYVTYNDDQQYPAFLVKYREPKDLLDLIIAHALKF